MSFREPRNGSSPATAPTVQGQVKGKPKTKQKMPRKEPGVNIDCGDTKKLTQPQSAAKSADRAMLPRATHHAPVRFGDLEVDGYVLQEGTASFSSRGVLKLMTGADTGNLSRYLTRLRDAEGGRRSATAKSAGPDGPQIAAISSDSSSESVGPDLRSIRFLSVDGSTVIDGYDADAVVDIFQRYARLANENKLRAEQIKIALRVSVVLGAVAREGLKLAIYSATGAKQYLEAQMVEDRLAASLKREAGKWMRLFSDEFFLTLARVLRVEAQRKGRRPPIFSAFIAKYFYAWFDQDVYNKLRQVNPLPTKGTKHHQFLTDFARERMEKHQRDVILLLRTSASLEDFDMRFGAAFRGQGLQIGLGLFASQQSAGDERGAR
jgi:hypothetical protein